MLPAVASMPSLLRQKEIAGIAGLDGDDVAAVAKLFDIFLKNDLHDVLLIRFRISIFKMRPPQKTAATISECWPV